MKSFSFVILWSVAASVLSVAQAATRPNAAFSLRPSYGGAVIEGRLNLPKSDTLLSVGSSLGFGRLLKCSPLCKVVTSFPVQNVTVLGDGTTYRVALGGDFKPGQKVAVTLRLKNQGTVTFQAPVTH